MQSVFINKVKKEDIGGERRWGGSRTCALQGCSL